MNSSPEDIAMNRYHISSGVTLLAGLLALPTSASLAQWAAVAGRVTDSASHHPLVSAQVYVGGTTLRTLDRKSTRLNSSHSQISYAVFCLKKKKNQYRITTYVRARPLQHEQLLYIPHFPTIPTTMYVSHMTCLSPVSRLSLRL